MKNCFKLLFLSFLASIGTNAEPPKLSLEESSITDFSKFINGIAKLSQQKPVELHLASLPEKTIRFGTESSYDIKEFHFLMIVFRKETIQINNGPSAEIISPKELSKRLEIFAKMSLANGHEPILRLVIEDQLPATRGFSLLKLLIQGNVSTFLIHEPTESQLE